MAAHDPVVDLTGDGPDFLKRPMPHGRMQSFIDLTGESDDEDASGSGPISAEAVKPILPKVVKNPTVSPNSSRPQVKQSPFYPYGSPLDNKQIRSGARQSSQTKNGDDVSLTSGRVSLPRERASDIVAPSPDPTSQASSNLIGKATSSSKPVEASPSARPPPKDQILPDEHKPLSENEENSSSESDSQEAPIESSKRSSRSNHRSQRSIPDSIGSSSPLLKRLEAQRRNAPLPSNPRKRDESPRDVIARHNLSKENGREALNPRKPHTITSLEESLRAFQQNMKDIHALTVRHLLRDAREAEAAREQLFVDAASPFGSLKGIQLEPKAQVPKGAYAEELDSYVS